MISDTQKIQILRDAVMLAIASIDGTLSDNRDFCLDQLRKALELTNHVEVIDVEHG